MHFLRFTADNEEKLRTQIALEEDSVSSARAAGNETQWLLSSIELGNLLTSARRERDACDVLSDVADLARVAPPEELGWWLLYLGTAKQYLNERPAARQLFNEALEIAQLHKFSALESYVLHHMGRCAVEEGEIELARSLFGRALVLREALGDPRQASSRRALEMLNETRWGPPD